MFQVPLSPQAFLLTEDKSLSSSTDLHPIHPIHSNDDRKVLPGLLFQSHLRPIHPIHKNIELEEGHNQIVSIASAPHPPYPPAAKYSSFRLH